MMAMCIRKDDLCYRVHWFKHWSHLETAHRHISTDYLISREDPLEEGMATHSSILAWKIPWTEEPGGLQSVGSQTVGHNWVTKQPTTSQVDIKLTIATMLFFELHLSVSTRQAKCRTACSVATFHCSDWSNWSNFALPCFLWPLQETSVSHPQVGGGTPILPVPRGGSLLQPWSAVLGKGNWRLHSGLGMRFS